MSDNDAADSLLDAARLVGDPPLDEVIASFFPEITDPKDMIRAVAMAMHGEAPPDGPLGDWLKQWDELPAWIDDELIERGQRMFRRWRLQIGFVLFGASLPWGYASAKGVQVLDRSGELVGTNIHRRLAETTQMLVDVHNFDFTSGKRIDPTKQAFRTIIGVRVLHAAIRRTIAAQPDWNPEWGVPINQEDLAGTLLTFTEVVFRGLERLGIVLSAREKRAYLHLWAVIGHILGIDPRLVCREPSSAENLLDRITARQHEPSREGEVLAKALLGDLEGRVWRGGRKVPRTFVYHLAGGNVADKLNIGKPAWWLNALRLMTRTHRLGTRLPFIRRALSLPWRMCAGMMFRTYIKEGMQRGDNPGVNRFRADSNDALAIDFAAGNVRFAFEEARRQWQFAAESEAEAAADAEADLAAALDHEPSPTSA